MLNERIREQAEGRKQLEQNHWLGLNIKFLEVWVKTLRARDYIETLGATISKTGPAKPKMDSLEVQKRTPPKVSQHPSLVALPGYAT